MKIKFLAIFGFIILIGFLLIGFFVFPIGITLCAIIGLCYGYFKNDRSLIKWSLAALSIGILLIIYTLFLIHAM